MLKFCGTTFVETAVYEDPFTRGNIVSETLNPVIFSPRCPYMQHFSIKQIFLPSPKKQKFWNSPEHFASKQCLCNSVSSLPEPSDTNRKQNIFACVQVAMQKKTSNLQTTAAEV